MIPTICRDNLSEFVRMDKHSYTELRTQAHMDLNTEINSRRHCTDIWKKIDDILDKDKNNRGQHSGKGRRGMRRDEIRQERRRAIHS